MATENKSLLQETIDVLSSAGKTISDVRFVVSGGRWLDRGDKLQLGSWDDFAKLADIKYDSGYGSAEINTTLKIVGDNWWLERGEYDGSEWWEFKTIPSKPTDTVPLQNIMDS